MPSVQQSIDIRAPIGVVFAAITDPRRAGEWNPHVIELRNLPSGAIGPGSKWQQKASMAGQTVDVTCTIVRFNPPFEGLLEYSGDQHGYIRTECSERNGLTHVTQTMEFDAPRGLAGAMAARLAQPMISREIAHSLQRVRDTLEREAGRGSGPRTT